MSNSVWLRSQSDMDTDSDRAKPDLNRTVEIIDRKILIVDRRRHFNSSREIDRYFDTATSSAVV